MYTYTIKTDALAVEIEASTIDAAAVMFGRSAGLSGDNCQEILESVSGVVGAWMWIESDDAPDGDRRGGSSPEVLQEYLAEVAAREAAENPPVWKSSPVSRRTRITPSLTSTASPSPSSRSRTEGLTASSRTGSMSRTSTSSAAGP
jgi:hypothetical protein